jgi:hypothetical protein
MRTGPPPGSGQVERFGNDPGKVRGLLHEIVVLCYIDGHPVGIDLLKGIGAIMEEGTCPVMAT